MVKLNIGKTIIVILMITWSRVGQGTQATVALDQQIIIIMVIITPGVDQTSLVLIGILWIGVGQGLLATLVIDQLILVKLGVDHQGATNVAIIHNPFTVIAVLI